jgi:hypothetical protein
MRRFVCGRQRPAWVQLGQVGDYARQVGSRVAVPQPPELAAAEAAISAGRSASAGIAICSTLAVPARRSVTMPKPRREASDGLRPGRESTRLYRWSRFPAGWQAWALSVHKVFCRRPVMGAAPIGSAAQDENDDLDLLALCRVGRCRRPSRGGVGIGGESDRPGRASSRVDHVDVRGLSVGAWGVMCWLGMPRVPAVAGPDRQGCCWP